MVGFFKPVPHLTFSAAGAVNGTTRVFLCTFSMDDYVNSKKIIKGFLEFDLLNASVVKPNLTYNETFATTYGREFSQEYGCAIADTGQTSGRLFDRTWYFPTPSGAGVKGWQYSSGAALTPVSRKHRYRVIEPQLVTLINIVSPANNLGKSSTSNLINDNAVFNLKAFTNLKYIKLNESFAASMTFYFPEKLVGFFMWEHANCTTLNGKLPKSTKTVMIAEMGTTNFNSFLSEAVNVEVLHLGVYAPSPVVAVGQSLSGTLQISHMSNLKELIVFNNPTALTQINLPAGKTDWSHFHIENCDAGFSTIPNTELEGVLDSPLVYFNIANNGRSWSRNFDMNDFPSSMIGFNIGGNSIVGNIHLLTARPGFKSFKASTISAHTGAQLNVLSIVDLTGLTNATEIDLTGCEVDDLELPVNTVITSLQLGDNNLSISTNPNLLSQIVAMTSLVNFRLAIGSNGAAVFGTGQNSVDGLGSNPDFSSLTSLTSFDVNFCKIVGTLTLPTGNILQGFNAAENPGLTNIVNLNKTSIAAVQLKNNPLLAIAFNISNSLVWSNIYLDSTGITEFDGSGRNSGGQITGMTITNNPSLTTIKFPASPHASEGYRNVTINGNASLSSLVDFGKSKPTVNTGFGVFNGSICALNISFPFGTGVGASDCIWRTILIQDNGMSQPNVDATIGNIYTNRSKWNVWNGSHPKSLNIGGTNAAPGGIYQAPAGFGLGSNDGTPVSALEQVYVLVNNYNWTITYSDNTFLFYDSNIGSMTETTWARQVGPGNLVETGSVDLVSGAINGRPAYEFSDNGDRMQCNLSSAPPFSNSDKLTMWLVSKNGGLTWSGSGYGITITNYEDNGRFYAIVNTAGGSATAYSNIFTNDWSVIVFVFNGAGATNSDKVKLFVNGAQLPLTFTTTVPSLTPNITGSVTIGPSTIIQPDGSVTNNRIAEACLFNDKLTDAQAYSLSSTLMTKYGL